MTECVAAVLPALEVIVPRIVGGVTTVLEEKAVGFGTITRDGLEVMLKGVLEDTGVLDLVRRGGGVGDGLVLEDNAPPRQPQT
jgi:hypothetical protein